MLFRKKMPKSCQYCSYSTKLTEDQMLCKKQGVVSVYYQCRKFQYDPLKRTPHRAAMPDFEKYEKDDYSL